MRRRWHYRPTVAPQRMSGSGRRDRVNCSVRLGAHMRIGILVVLFAITPLDAAAPPTTKAIKIPQTQPVPREQWGAPLVDVKRDGDTWTIAGRKQIVTLDARDLSMRIAAGP